MMGKRMEEHNMAIYMPIIKSLTIRESKIHGLGVFAVTDILKNIELGLTHIEVICPYTGEFELIRTPLGGFYNHSDEPNCQKYKVGIKYFLKTIKDILAGEEITVTYSFYKIKGRDKI